VDEARVLHPHLVVAPGCRLHAGPGGFVESIEHLPSRSRVDIAGGRVDASKVPIDGRHAGAIEGNATRCSEQLLRVDRDQAIM
jgi:hypothetical protein